MYENFLVFHIEIMLTYWPVVYHARLFLLRENNWGLTMNVICFRRH